MSEALLEVLSQGQRCYTLCVSCHGSEGEGVSHLGPPLAGSEWVLGPKDNLILIQFRGLRGPLQVKGESWNHTMPPTSPMLQKDENIASVLTFIRKSWGNNASMVTPEEVSRYRGEEGQPMLTVEDLQSPGSDATTTQGVIRSLQTFQEEEQPSADSKLGKEGGYLLVSLGGACLGLCVLIFVLRANINRSKSKRPSKK